MIKFNELKIGDYVVGEYEGKTWPGKVTDLNSTDKEICVETEVQEIWFEEEHLFPIPITDQSLLELNFAKETLPDGFIKYKKGPFRIVTPTDSNFSSFEIWYREDIRKNPDIHYIHQLQNAYLQMTKVHLTNEVVV